MGLFLCLNKRVKSMATVWKDSNEVIKMVYELLSNELGKLDKKWQVSLSFIKIKIMENKVKK